MSSASTSLKRLNWLARVRQRMPGATPIVIDAGSIWQVPIAGALLGKETIVLLKPGDEAGTAIPYTDISSATITEDDKQCYAIELRFRDDQTPPATLVLLDMPFFMLTFAALTRADVTCHFNFTEKRLRRLGAGR